MMENRDEEVKQEILQTAKSVFQKWGLSKTTMEDIANEAGKGRSTLYYYYKNKYEIFNAFIVQEYGLVVSRCRTKIQTIDSSKEKLRIFVSELLKEIKLNANLYPLLLGEVRGNKIFIEQLLKKMDDLNIGMIKGILKEGLISGEFAHFKESELDKAASAVTVIIRGFVQFTALDEDDERSDLLIRMIANGI